MNKIKKSNKISDTRPLTLLTCMRKILALIVQNRIYPKETNISLLVKAPIYYGRTLSIWLQHKWTKMNSTLWEWTSENHSTVSIGRDSPRRGWIPNSTSPLNRQKTSNQGCKLPTAALSPPQLVYRKVMRFLPYSSRSIVRQPSANIYPTLSHSPTPCSASLKIKHYADVIDLVTSNTADTLITNISLPENLTSNTTCMWKLINK